MQTNIVRRNQKAIHGIGRKGALQLIWRDRYLYLILLPVLIHLFIFSYLPMYGLVIAFQNYKIGSPMIAFNGMVEWVGFDNFIRFFKSIYFFRVLKNTLLNSILYLAIGFWVPIVFALILNEIRHNLYKRVVQTLSYLPYFISIVVVSGIVVNFLSAQDGIVNILLENLGMEKIKFLNEPQYFRPIYVITNIWQNFGWSAVIYLASIAAIDQNLYEAAKIDGANRWQQVLYITIPCISSTVMVLLVLAIGSVMLDNTEKIILLYNPAIYETADGIGSFTYRNGILEGKYSYAAAIGIFTAVINFILLSLANRFSKKVSDSGLW